jgi:NAD(P)-dependent dehydrogenase (short-subunit alcohol dehydrogenase family)
MSSKRSILITGCSEGGLGAALAQAFQDTGRWRVLASARNLKSMDHLAASGIETLELDVLSEMSIKSAVEKVSALTDGKLDALLLNAGGGLAVSSHCQHAGMMRRRFITKLSRNDNHLLIQAPYYSVPWLTCLSMQCDDFSSSTCSRPLPRFRRSNHCS